MQTKELFELIIKIPGWWKNVGITDGHSRAILTRHRNGSLSMQMYNKIFTAYGYKKELIWTK